VRPICIYGAGALGSVLGALLSQRTAVTLVGREPHVSAIHRQGGLRVTGQHAALYPLQATTTCRVPEAARILVTVKAFDLEAALRELAPHLDSSHLVVVLQNGLGIRELAERVLGRRVVRAVTFTAASFEEPGHVALHALGKTYFPPERELLELWDSCGIPAVGTEDMGIYEWRKLAINAVINPLSALLRVRNVDLEETQAKVLASMEQTGTNRSSMLQDIRAQRPTEIEWINGAIVRLARKHAIPVPRHQQLLELVHFVAQSVTQTDRPRPVHP